MKVMVSKNYWCDKLMLENDREAIQRFDITTRTDYSPVFEEMDVTMDELIELVEQNCAIKINC